MLFQDFQAGHHGSHLRYGNGMNLAFLNQSPGHPNGRISAILNLHVAQMPSSYQVWAQSDLGFGIRCGLKIFKKTAQVAILDR